MQIICGTKCAIGNAGLQLIDYSPYTSKDMLLFQQKCLLMNSKVVPKWPYSGFYLCYCSTVSNHLAAQSSIKKEILAFVTFYGINTHVNWCKFSGFYLCLGLELGSLAKASFLMLLSQQQKREEIWCLDEKKAAQGRKEEQLKYNWGK